MYCFIIRFQEEIVGPTLTINGRIIGQEQPVYIIAELSGNHHQNFDEAVRMIREAKRCGADAVKIQTYTADTMTLDSDASWFRIGGSTLWDGRTLYSLYAEAFTPWDWQPRLQEVAISEGMDFFSSPFDATATDFLQNMGVPAFKIASFELTDLPLLRHVAATGKPMILSTGMATLAEIDEAVRTIRDAGATDIALLKCNSAYPAPPSEMNLRTIPHLSSAFQVVTGLSDHTMELAVPVTAVALGARIIEKHFILQRSDGGPDAAFSLEPEEFRSMVQGVRVAEQALGAVGYAISEKEAGNRDYRRSVFVSRTMKAGEVFTVENTRVIRPAFGLAPKYHQDILGRVARCDIERGTPLTWDLVG